MRTSLAISLLSLCHYPRHVMWTRWHWVSSGVDCATCGSWPGTRGIWSGPIRRWERSVWPAPWCCCRSEPWSCRCFLGPAPVSASDTAEHNVHAHNILEKTGPYFYCIINDYLWSPIYCSLIFLFFSENLYIYIYAFSRRFYPKRLTIAGYTFSLVCSLGIEPTTFCAADAMLYHWATQELWYIVTYTKYIDYISLGVCWTFALKH